MRKLVFALAVFLGVATFAVIVAPAFVSGAHACENSNHQS
jgi:hypothetical protein